MSSRSQPPPRSLPWKEMERGGATSRKLGGDPQRILTGGAGRGNSVGGWVGLHRWHSGEKPAPLTSSGPQRPKSRLQSAAPDDKGKLKAIFTAYPAPCTQSLFLSRDFFVCNGRPTVTGGMAMKKKLEKKGMNMDDGEGLDRTELESIKRVRRMPSLSLSLSLSLSITPSPVDAPIPSLVLVSSDTMST